jgi:2,4-dienoyl-CoA reductase-like NADH-dependent reductase (Old Yellow Enzyme family)
MSIDLFQPYKIGKLEIRNRFVRSPCGDTWADDFGNVTVDSLSYYGKLASGGVGLIEAGNAAISKHAHVPPRGGHWIDSDDKIPGWTKVTKLVHENGSKIALQISHCGGLSAYLRYRGNTLAVSDTPLLDERSPSPKIGQSHRVMTEEDIEAIIDAFAAAAKRSVEAGFDAINLHGVPGYLFGQFLSPLYNLRIDKWGGSPDKRRKFHIEVVSRVRQAIGPNIPIIIKMGIRERRKGGLPLEEGIEAARQMVVAGIDAIEVLGSPPPVPNSTNPHSWWGGTMGKPESAWGRDDAEALKRAVNVQTMLVGGIRSVGMCQSLVDNNITDMISLGCPLIREPDLINRWHSGDHKPARCITCDRCHGIAGSGQKLECGEEARIRDRFGI